MGFSPLSLSQSLSFIMFLFHFHSTISSSHFCAPDQSLSLLQFKESFSINSSASGRCHHPKTESWKEGTGCCLWDGVSCDMKTGHVTALDLSCSMLYGTLHSNSTLFSLHHLQKLDLSDNDFNNSHISPRFGQFSNLTLLNLNSSVFAGQVPSEISHLSKLVSLDLSGNYDPSLEPISFAKLVRNLTELRELDLSRVNMSLVAPNSLTNLSSSLSSLSLWGCGLQGKFPGNIFLLPKLESLDMSYNNRLTGSFPSSNLSNVLSSLDLSNTRISVYLENDLISNLKSLEYMYLRNSNIIRSDLAPLGNLTQLILLDFSSNNFIGEIPSSLGNLVQLRYLKLDSNKFMGQIPDSLGSLLNLRTLSLYGNLFNGTIPSFLFALPSLQYLDLHNNNLIGNISELQHDSLVYLDLSNNHLHGPIPSSIFKQENLEVLILASNSKLTGEISSSICKLRFLRLLDLSNNSLSGSTPLCLGNFSNMLSVLHLGMNNLQGTIPSIFSKNNSLEYLNLNGNELEGKIPPSIISCTLLEVLDLGNNKIEDTFPYFLETLPKLQILVLKSNKLQGFVKGPTTYNSFSKLQIFDISDNNFSESLPTARIDDLKLRWQPTIAALFRLNGADKTLKPAGVLLYMRIETFLWWFGSLRWPEMGDRRRERESPTRGERCSGLCYGENVSTVDRTVQMNGGLIGCNAVHRNRGTPVDVAQRDQSLDYFKG
ncbi:receptor-like protein 9DC3 [Populus trichocarpa]|uniref:receptor-like protein 9DC3 n=1 Tax=Populus trichocarpa TaxID=3694 RepID=UPI0022782483|nr:receptor-like protein 9DC3 [Populus trichocarpa]